ncbi:hypothetical protein J3F83DRAFT_442435 [Trichoderma novae-zelandiae]
MPQSTSGQQEAQNDEACYPPCLHHTADEKKLYKRLKDAYLENYASWDAESREAWRYIVEHASLPKSTVGKVTNHSIARNMMHAKVTWAHVVALRVIYKGQLFKSKKLMKLIRDKYPRANLNTHVFQEGYKRPMKIDEEARAEKTARSSPAAAAGAHEPRAGSEEPAGEASQPAPRRLTDVSSGFLSDEEDVRPAKTVVPPNSTWPGHTAVAVGRGKEGHSAMEQQNDNKASNRQRGANPSSQRKRALPEDTEEESEAEHRAAREPPPRKQKTDRPASAVHDRRARPTSSGKGPHSQEEATGGSGRPKEDRDDKLDRFIEALTGFGKSLSEHSKAVDRNSELLGRLTEQIRKRSTRRS